MTLFRFSALALLATGCFGTTADTETGPAPDDDAGVDADGDSYDEGDDCDDDNDAVNPGEDEDCEDGEDNDCDDDVDADDSDCEVAADTGIAYLTWTGDMTYDGSSVVVNYGFGAVNDATGENVCTMTVEHVGSDVAPAACPDCVYSFGTVPNGGEVAGDYCDSFTADTVFTYYTVSDMWFSREEVKAWGFADLYIYTYNGTDYEFTNNVFMYYDDGADFHQWLLRHYNIPSLGVYSVDGDSSASSWNPHFTYGGEEFYYYFYY